jgi:hypothetical protein
MPIPLKLTCSPHQACHYSTTGRVRFGYLNALSIHGEALSPDVLVAEPLSDGSAPIEKEPQGGAHRNPHAGVFTKAVVGVLEFVRWPNGRPSDSISMDFLVSAANASILEMLFRQQQPHQSLKVEFALVVYDWDYEDGCYYFRFCTHQGSGSSAASTRGFESDAKASGRSLEATLGSGSVDEEPVDDDELGAILYSASLTLIPPKAEQLFRIATSQKDKQPLPWGEPEEDDLREAFQQLFGGEG